MKSDYSTLEKATSKPMDMPIEIIPYQKGQEEAIYQLIKKVYDEFVAVDYSVEGNDFFYDWIKPKNIAKRQKKQVNLWVAHSDSKIVGMIEIRDNKYLSLLFVDKEYQRRGIATSLFREALKVCIRRDPKMKKIHLHSSPFAIPVYKKMGFVPTDSILEENGIKYLPMEMAIK
ncbi:MAG: GNAT family N-acetyltransferase [Bacteroidota bacterium]|nr:GNAT family N-acetyltransferase [Bacteroidota bacterium]